MKKFARVWRPFQALCLGLLVLAALSFAAGCSDHDLGQPIGVVGAVKGGYTLSQGDPLNLGGITVTAYYDGTYGGTTVWMEDYSVIWWQNPVKNSDGSYTLTNPKPTFLWDTDVTATSGDKVLTVTYEGVQSAPFTLKVN